MKILGVDISTKTGMALVGEDEDRGKTIHLPKERGMHRVQLIAEEFDRTLEVWRPDFAVLEGYAYLRNIGVFVTLVEVGTILRLMLARRIIPWYVVPVTVLKKWTTGHGNAKKADMSLAVKARWGYESPSDDIIDAYALAQMGLLGPDELLKVTGVFLGR